MSVLFLLICVASLVFFAVFLVQCSRPRRASRKAPVVIKLSTTEAVDSAAGQRALVHLEQQMAEFLSTRGRSIAALLLAAGLFGTATQMKAQSSASPESPTNAADQAIAPAIQKQLDAMQKRIDELEHRYSALLPHGLRTNCKVNSKLALSDWLVNGKAQFENINKFKNQMFGFALAARRTA